MKASELIAELVEYIKSHGDLDVYSGGEDFPGEVRGVIWHQERDSYIPKDTFKICGG